MTKTPTHPTDPRDALQSAERRRFFDVARRYGFTTAVMASTGGFLWSTPDVARAADDEAARAKAAKQTMIFATEYKDDAFHTYPIMQTQFKENLQSISKGEVYVKLYPAASSASAARSRRRCRPARCRAARCRCRTSRRSRRWWT